MSQFFAHILPKPKQEIGTVTSSETHERFTCVQIVGTDLHDLLVHFACEKSGLRKDQITRIELHRDSYASTSIDQSLTVHFVEKLDAASGDRS